MAIHTAKGTLVKLGDGASPEVFATIGQVRSISGPSTTASVVDVTTHSTAGYWMEKMAVLIDPGSLDFPINFDPLDASHAFATGLWNLFINLTLRNFQVALSGSSGLLSLSGLITSHSFDLPVDNVIVANISITIYGAIAATVS